HSTSAKSVASTSAGTPSSSLTLGSTPLAKRRDSAGASPRSIAWMRERRASFVWADNETTERAATPSSRKHRTRDATVDIDDATALRTRMCFLDSDGYNINARNHTVLCGSGLLRSANDESTLRGSHRQRRCRARRGSLLAFNRADARQQPDDFH